MKKVKVEEKEKKVKSIIISGVNIIDLFKDNIKEYCKKNKLQPILLTVINTGKESVGFISQTPEGVKKKIIDFQSTSKDVMKKIITLFEEEV